MEANSDSRDRLKCLSNALRPPLNTLWGRMHVDLFRFTEAFFAGLLAGFEVTVHYGVAVSLTSLGETAQILIRQALITRLRMLAPALFLPTLVSALVILVRTWHTPEAWLQGVSVTALLLWIAIRIVRTIPVNSATLKWKASEPPANWHSLIHRTEQFHTIAAWAALLAFTCALISTLKFE